MSVLLFAEESYAIMGCGFLEAVYQEGLEIEFDYQRIPFQSQQELKAVSQLIDEHRAQVLNYLNATKLQLGLLVNFGHYPKLEYERFILTEDSAEIQPTK